MESKSHKFKITACIKNVQKNAKSPKINVCLQLLDLWLWELHNQLTKLELWHTVWFQIISMPTPWKVIGKSWGGGESEQPKFIRLSMKLNQKFQGGGKVQTKKTFRGRGMDIFWNHTLQKLLRMIISHAYSPNKTTCSNFIFIQFTVYNYVSFYHNIYNYLSKTVDRLLKALGF